MKNYSLEESQKCLTLVSNLFVDWTKRVLDINELDKLYLVGSGNSISSGWSNHTNDVRPLLLKLEPYILDKASSEDVNIRIASFPIAHDNSNEGIYNFLKNNPSLTDVHNYFNLTLEDWKKVFGNTPLKYTIDADLALSLYPQSNLKLNDCYDNKTLTVTNFNGFTGQFLDDIGNNLEKSIDRELLFMEKILELFLSKSKSSYMTIGNFPKIPNHNPLNILIDRFINNRIQASIKEANITNPGKVLYFDKTFLHFINLADDEATSLLDEIKKARSLSLNNLIKIDNHPNIKLQYLYLSRYLLFIMETLPKYIAWYHKECLDNPNIIEKNEELAEYSHEIIKSYNLQKL